MAWAGDERTLHLALLSGSVLFVGGRRSGTTHVVRALEQSLETDEVVSTHSVDLSMLPPLEGPRELLRELALSSAHEALDREDLALACRTMADAILADGKRLHVVVVDRFDLVAGYPWAFPFTAALRYLLSSCPALRLAAFCRPRTVEVLGGESSPLVNMMKLLRATRADASLVRDDLVRSGLLVDSVMNAYRIAGGLPHLIRPAAELFARGMRSDEVTDAMAGTEAAFFDRQHEELTTTAKRVVSLLAMDAPRGAASIGEDLGLNDVQTAMAELASYMLAECQNGEWRLTCPIHQRWFALSAWSLAAGPPRPSLGAGDEGAYRQLSQLEWLARGWLEERLSRAIDVDWWDSVIPGTIRLRVEKRQAFEKADQRVSAGDHLVDYLDFTDFREILRLKAVWDNAFAGTSVEVWRDRLFDALERLEAIRRKVAHSRPLTPDEVAMLSVDVSTVRDVMSRSA